MNPANDNAFFTAPRMMKFGTALGFDFLKFILGLMFILLPPILGAALGIYTAEKCGAILPDWIPGKGWVCNATGTVVGTVVTLGGYDLEYGTGVGAAAVEAVGDVLDDVIDWLAWLFFTIWFMVTGVRFFGGKRATNRFLAGSTSVIVGSLPFINLLPTITAGVVTIEWQQWLENKEQAVIDRAKGSRDQTLARQHVQLEQAQLEREQEYALAMQRAQMQAANDDEQAAEEQAQAA